MSLPKVEIKLEADGQALITVDGVVIPGVGAFSLESVPGEAPKLVMELIPGCVSVEAEAILTPHIQRAAVERARRTHS